MLHTKAQGYRSSGSGEDFTRIVNHILAWKSSWSCDQDHLNKLWFGESPTTRNLHTEFEFNWPEMFENVDRLTMDAIVIGILSAHRRAFFFFFLHANIISYHNRIFD